VFPSIGGTVTFAATNPASLAGAALTLAGLFYNSILVWGGLLMFLGLLVTAVTLKEITYESAA
jgi:hypothetical protein